tara:strand:- start:627 stop:959 length:333 start_codon:yes stop_codon:yes gene_type:complete
MLSQKKCVPCQGGIPPLDINEINHLIKELDSDWHVHKNKDIRKEYTFNKYSDAVLFANNIAKIAEDEDHHPFIHINYKKVLIILFTHKIDGLHENDFILAYKFDLLYKTK